MRDAQLSQLRAKEVEAAEKVRAANEWVVASLEAEREALVQTERERFVAQARNRHAPCAGPAGVQPNLGT